MKKNKKLQFWIFYHLGLLLVAFGSAAILKFSREGKIFTRTTFPLILTIFVMSALIGYLAIFLINRSKKMSHAELTKRVVPAFIFFLLIAFLIVTFSVSISVFIMFIIDDIELGSFISHLINNELPVAWRSMFFWFLFFSISFFYVLWRKSAKKEQELREEKLKFQYQTLKSQINPHFLFNSFNALSELVHEDAQKADNYIQELSKMYRYIIENEDNQLVPLNDELDFVNHYFNLQKVRNKEKIQLHVDIHNAGDYKVVPVSVQSLVENAIKHNSASTASPLQIDVFIEAGNVVVKNNFQKKTTFEATTQKGLKNLKEQVRLILDKELTIFENKNEFVVKVPIQS